MPSLLVDIGANIARLQSDMQKASDSIEGFTKSASNAFKAIGGYLAADKIIGAVKDVTKAFMEDEAAINKMSVAMKNQGDYSKNALADLKEFGEQIQKTTAYSDDEAMKIMANLKTYGMLNKEVKQATQIALDFAAAKKDEGMTVEQAGELIGKAYLGNTERLKRYGIVIDESKSRSERLNDVIKQLQERFGGAAASELDTYAGQFKKMGNDWESIKEDAGELALVIADPLIPQIRNLLKAAKEATEGVKLLFSIGPEAKRDKERMELLDQIHKKEEVLANFKKLQGTAYGRAIGADQYVESTAKEIKDLDLKLTKLSADANAAKIAGDVIMPGGKRTEPMLETGSASIMHRAFEGQAKAAAEGYYSDLADWQKERTNQLEREADVQWKIKEIITKIQEKQSSAIAGGYYEDLVNYQKESLAQLDREGQKRKELEPIMAKVYEGEAKQSAKGYYDDLQYWEEEKTKNLVRNSEKILDLNAATAEAMGKDFKSLFLDVMQGNLTSFSDFWQKTWETMQKVASDYLGQIATDFLFGKETKAGGRQGGLVSQISDALSGLFKKDKGGGEGLGNILGSIGAGGGESLFGGMESLFSFHGGGVVGQTSAPSRLMPSSLMLGAPRLHGGLAADEMPAILQKGETVTPKGGGGKQAMSMNVTINATDAKSFVELSHRNPSAIIGPFLDALKQGGYLVDTIKSVVR